MPIDSDNSSSSSSASPSDESSSSSSSTEELSSQSSSSSSTSGSTDSATSSGTNPATPPEDGACGCDCDCGGGGGGGRTSGNSIRYATGEVQYSATDLSIGGYGLPWGHTRSFSSRLSDNDDQGAGWNWQVAQWPYLVEVPTAAPGENKVVAMGRALEAQWFKASATEQHAPAFDGTQRLAFADDGGAQMATVGGQLYEFFPDTLGFRKITAPGGAALEVVGRTPDLSKPTDVRRSVTVGGVTTTEAFLYSYATGGDGAQRLQSVTLQRKVGAGAWTNIRRAVYTYHSGGSHGRLGDLETATTQEWTGSAWQDLGTSYYRYWATNTPSGSPTVPGVPVGHLLKFVVEPQTFAKMQAASIDPLTASNATLAQYADYYWEYDAHRRVVLEMVQGGSRSFQYAYAESAFPDGPNSWKTKTVETLPGGDQVAIYSSHAGFPMLKVETSGGQQWLTFWKYDANDRVVWQASPSAVSGYDEQYADLLHEVSGNYEYLKDAEGLIEGFAYHAASGQRSLATVQQGELGTPIKIWEKEFATRTLEASSSSSSGGGLTERSVYPVSKLIQYPDADDQDVTIETLYSYQWHPGTLQMSQRETTLPVVSTAQNGSGVAATTTEVFDLDGRRTWRRDERGFITNWTYDVVTGALTRRIDDVDTSTASGVPTGWTTPSGGGLNLVTDYESDELGRTTQVLGPSHQIDLDGTATTVRRANWTVYQDATHQVWSGGGYATGSGPSYAYTLVNPVSITKSDVGGRTLEEISAVRASTSGKLSASDSFPQTSYVRWTTYQYSDCCKLASQRAYHLIPDSGVGTVGTNYGQTDYGYDVRNRQIRVVSPGGTITRTVFGPRSLPIGSWVGTNDTGATATNPAGSGSPNNMVQVAGMEYDGGDDGGDGNLTEQTAYVDGATSRVTSFGYDWRNRRTTTDGELDYFARVFYDNLGRVVRNERYDTDEEGNLVAKSETAHDDRGRVYRTTRYGVDPSTGTVGHALVSNVWYDAAGNQVKSLSAGSSAFTKTLFDSLGRSVGSYVGYYTESGDEPYAEVSQITSDNKIFEQTCRVYDDASNLIQTASCQRWHDATGNGVLQLPTGSQPKARISYVATYPDGVGRTQAAANYGTNGNAAFSRSATIPTRSDDVLVNSTTYDEAGDVAATVDADGREDRFSYDDLGRRLELIENYESSPSSSSSSSSTSLPSSSSSDDCPLPPAPADSDVNRTTHWTYNLDGAVVSMTAVNPTTGDQTTEYVYGTTLSDSAIASNFLLRRTLYPDSTGTADGVANTYNRQGQFTAVTDQNGTVHAYEYDALGRETQDRVITTGTGVDDAVLRMSTTYNVRGQIESVTSWDDANVVAGNVVNEVKRVYNDFAQLSQEYQSPTGPVTPATTPKVSYSYADGSTNTIRPTGIIYPSGYAVSYGYGSSGSDDDRLSRIAALTWEGKATSYTYLGVDSIVEFSSVSPSFLKWTQITGSSPNPYAGLDRFGRQLTSLWTGTSGPFSEINYGYDRSGNRLWREVVGPSEQDELYTYDGLNRLTMFVRGDLNVGHSGITSPQREQDWTLDVSDNWARFSDSDLATPAASYSQGRVSNPVNEIECFKAISGPTWAEPAYDAAGNMTAFPSASDPTIGVSAIYDAWRRLVRGGDTGMEIYRYDALGRRVSKSFEGGATLSYFFSEDWQTLEQFVDTADEPEFVYVWGLRFVDEMLVRELVEEGSSAAGEQMLAIQDANFNVVAIVEDDNGDARVAERYRFTPYGETTVLAADYSVRGESDYSWTYGFSGRPKLSTSSGTVDNRHRVLSPQLGSFLTRDPAATEQSAENTYIYVAANPIVYVDPYGLQLQGRFEGDDGQFAAAGGWGNSVYRLSGFTVGRYYIQFFQVDLTLDCTQPAGALAGNMWTSEGADLFRGVPLPNGFRDRHGVYVKGICEIRSFRSVPYECCTAGTWESRWQGTWYEVQFRQLPQDLADRLQNRGGGGKKYTETEYVTNCKGETQTVAPPNTSQEWSAFYAQHIASMSAPLLTVTQYASGTFSRNQARECTVQTDHVSTPDYTSYPWN